MAKRMYDFGRAPAKRDYTVKDLQDLKGSGTVLSMSNPANEAELHACLEAEIDLLVVWAEQLDECRRIAPTQFMGIRRWPRSPWWVCPTTRTGRSSAPSSAPLMA